MRAARGRKQRQNNYEIKNYKRNNRKTALVVVGSRFARVEQRTETR